MIRYIVILSVLVLSACQTNPLTELDYQSDYDFYRSQSWQWAEPAVQFLPDSASHKSDLDAERVRAAIHQQLTQRGYPYSAAAELQVRAWLITEDKQQRTQVMESDYWGGIWGPSLRAHSYDTSYTEQKLQVDILTTDNQQLIWRGSNTWVLPKQRTRPADRSAKLQQQVQGVLHYFPPH